MTNKSSSSRPSGIKGFMIVGVGQMISVLASSMTGFALTIVIFTESNSATALGLMTSSFLVPFLIFSPIAGAMVDRYNRKLMMMISDVTAALGTLIIFVLYATDTIQIWHFYIVGILLGIGNTFQWPAYSAAITTMVPKEHLGRANGIMSLVNSGPNIVAPLMGGALLPVIGLKGILLIDFLTFFIAIGALLFVVVPQPEKTKEGQEGKGSLLKEAAYGFKYIFQRPSLIYLQSILFLSNIFIGFRNALFAPMILSRTANDSLAFGSVQSAGAIAFTVGGLVMSAWAGFNRKIKGMFLGWGSFMFFGVFLFGFGRGLPIWISMTAIAAFGAIMGSTSANAIWQSKVAADVQGRVFSARRLIAWVPDPIMPIVAGLMADKIFEPAMQSDTALAANFEWLVGNGPGAGMALLIIGTGLLGVLTLAFGYFIPAVRNIEDILPDHDELEKVETEEEPEVDEEK